MTKPTQTLTHDTDPTRYRFPQFFSPSHTDHIANLETALFKVMEDRLRMGTENLQASEMAHKLKSVLEKVRDCPHIKCCTCIEAIEDALKK